MSRITTLLLALLCGCAAWAFRTDSAVVATKHLATPMNLTVIVPDGADEARFPTVYLLNGYGGNHLAWPKSAPELGNLADAFKMIIVCPDGRDSWYWDSPVDPGMQMESFFVNDLIPFVDSHYPTLPVRENRAITGLSMGGHGSLFLATRHPELWANAGSMSGGVDIRPFVKRWKMEKNLGKSYEEDPQLWDSHTVAALVPQMKEAGLNITFDCGADDFFAEVNAQLHQAMLDAGVQHDYTSRPGNHSWKYWTNSLPYHLLYFNSKFPR